MFASNGGSHNYSQGASNSTKPINEPWWFTQTLGIFGSRVTNFR